jgi:hypothetical protein
MSGEIGGQRLVVGIYLIIVCFTGVAGYLTAGAVDEITSPRFLFLIEFPATRLGLAASSMLTVAVVLGILLGLVIVISNRFDEQNMTNE